MERTSYIAFGESEGGILSEGSRTNVDRGPFLIITRSYHVFKSMNRGRELDATVLAGFSIISYGI